MVANHGHAAITAQIAQRATSAALGFGCVVKSWCARVMIYDFILDMIGRILIVRINWLALSAVTMYVKVESFNPGGLVKDRLAIGVIEDVEQRGVLKPG